jgi:tetratricopeptide (TPR) repeat protein
MSDEAKQRRESRYRINRWVDDLRLSDATGDERIGAVEDRLKVEADETAIEVLKVCLAIEHTEQGNEAVADALWREVLSEVDYWYRKLTRTNRRAFDKNIRAIEDRIRANPDAPEVDELYRCLSDQYSAHGDFAAAEAINLELAERHPDDPLPLNSVATNKLSFLNQPEEAMDVINRALEVAHRTGELRRYTLGNKARIALDLKRYDIVEGVLKEIMQLKIDPDVPDIGRERDFFDRLPPDSIDPEIARQYNEYCLAVGLQPRPLVGDKRFPPDEPPEWTDPEEGFDPGR